MRALALIVGAILLGVVAVLICGFAIWWLTPTATGGAYLPGYMQSVHIAALAYVLGSAARGVSVDSK